jgi:predicted Fe-Mo cluster-binding NifX family protein
MKIAIASQNRKTVTGHAGKCRKFWVYQIDGKAITTRELLELPIEQSFHESDHDQPHPLDGIDVLICGGIGLGLQNRLKQRAILAVATSETDLDRAVAGWLDGTLPEAEPEDHAHGHSHGHRHAHTRQSEQTAVVELKLSF